MIDAFSQTSDEFLDDSEESSSKDDSLKEDEKAEEELIRASPSASSRPSSRGILGRLTSAHIRQFVSPDFKLDLLHFHVPSLALNAKPLTTIETSPRKLKEKIRNKVETELIRSIVHKNAKMLVEKRGTTKQNKEKRKIKKGILDRLCSPTLSFILKTSKQPDETSDEKYGKSSDHCHSAPSPCERFNRRNPNN